MLDETVPRLRDITAPFRVKPGRSVSLATDFDPAYTADFVSKKDADEFVENGVRLLSEYQERLSAQDTWGVLVCLQALDAAGKDGTISHVMSGVNPQGVHVASFKAPSAEELDHDYLWRFSRHLPARGDIAIFNRSHYEEVLVVRVHPEILQGQRLPQETRHDGVWERRYRDINAWEQHLADNGFKIVKIFLNISREEQRQRFLARVEEPEKNWKFSVNDVRERAHWDAYQEAYSEMLSRTSTEWAPWYVIPADHKWFARSCVSAVLALTLMEIDPQYPTLDDAARRAMEEARALLEAEAPTAEKEQPADPAAEKAAGIAGEPKPARKPTKKNGKKGSR